MGTKDVTFPSTDLKIKKPSNDIKTPDVGLNLDGDLSSSPHDEPEEKSSKFSLGFGKKGKKKKEKVPELNADINTNLSVEVSKGINLPSVDTDSGAQSPDLQLHMPSP